MTKQPEALRLADACDAEQVATVKRDVLMYGTAAELRRLHEVNAELLEALKRVIDCCDISECLTVPNSPGAIRNARAAIKKATG